MMRCLLGVLFVVVVLVVMVMFDWLNAREWVMDGLSGLQQGVEVLAEWGDALQGGVEKTGEVVEQAGEAVDATRATVEKIQQ